MTKSELVSVIITTYYRNDWLPKAIQSAMNQTHENVEILVVDDSGEEHARPVVEEFPEVIYVPQDRNQGPMASRNLGFERANGEYIHFLDDDDLLRPDKIRKQLDVLRDDDDVGVVYTGLYRERDEHILLPDEDARGDFLERVLKMQQPPCFPSTMLIDREFLESVMPVEPRYDGAGDVVLIIELAKRTQFDFVGEPLIVRGEDDESLAYTQTGVISQRRILDEYRDLYEQFPDDVRKTALAGSYSIEGQVRLRGREWSLDAIRSFALAAFHSPGIDLRYIGSFLMSLLGRRAWLKGRELFIRIRKLSGSLTRKTHRSNTRESADSS